MPSLQIPHENGKILRLEENALSELAFGSNGKENTLLPHSFSKGSLLQRTLARTALINHTQRQAFFDIEHIVPEGSRFLTGGNRDNIGEAGIILPVLLKS